MLNNKWLWISIIGFIILLIGGKFYMDEKDKKELLEIQKYLGENISNNYILYKVDNKEEELIIKEFNRGQGSITENEYFEKLDKIRKYEDITMIEFTGYSITPMNSVKIHFIINGVYKDEIILDKVSSETNKPIYTISTNSGNGPIYIDKKTESKNDTPVKIKFYEGKVE